MNDPEDNRAFWKLLRWYPRAWRIAHGYALVGMLLDDAEHHGRSRPSSRDTRSAMIHGLAARLNNRAALMWASVGIFGAVTASLSRIWIVPRGADFQHEVTLLLSAGLAPAASAIALVAVLRSRGTLRDARSLLIVLLTVFASTCGGLAAVSWSRGFDLANAGLAQTGLAATFVPLAASGVSLSAIALSMVLFDIFDRLRVSTAARIAVSGVGGVIVAPILAAAAFMSPLVSGMMALVSLLMAAHTSREHTTSQISRAHTLPPSQSRPRAARVLGFLAFAIGALGLALAFTGASWSPLSGDSTSAMRQGIITLSLATIPGLVGLGLVASARSSMSPRNIWIAVVAAATGFALVATDYAVSTGAGDIGPIWVAAAASVGISIGLIVGARTPTSMPLRLVVGFAAAVAYTALIGIMIAPLLTFIAPVLGLALMVTPRRHPRNSRLRRPALKS